MVASCLSKEGEPGTSGCTGIQRRQKFLKVSSDDPEIIGLPSKGGPEEMSLSSNTLTPSSVSSGEQQVTSGILTEGLTLFFCIFTINAT